MREIRNGLQVGVMGIHVTSPRDHATGFTESKAAPEALDEIIVEIASGREPEGLTKEVLVAAMPAVCDLISRLLQEEMGKACRAAVDGHGIAEKVARQRSATLLWRLDRAVGSAGDVRRIPHELVPSGFCARWGEEAGRSRELRSREILKLYRNAIPLPTQDVSGSAVGELWEARSGQVVRVMAEMSRRYADGSVDVAANFWRGGAPCEADNWDWDPEKRFVRIGGPGWARRADACRRCGAPTVREWKYGHRPFMAAIMVCATRPRCDETRDADVLGLVGAPLRGGS